MGHGVVGAEGMAPARDEACVAAAATARAGRVEVHFREPPADLDGTRARVRGDHRRAPWHNTHDRVCRRDCGSSAMTRRAITTEKAEATRDRILDTALRLFRER